MSTQAYQADSAFVGVGKEAGLVLWRIENKQVVKQAAVSAETAWMRGTCVLRCLLLIEF